MDMQESVDMHIWIPRDVYGKLVQRAQINDVSLAALMRALIAQYLEAFSEDEPQPQPAEEQPEANEIIQAPQGYTLG